MENLANGIKISHSSPSVQEPLFYVFPLDISLLALSTSRKLLITTGD
jgi:hypothetical protein